MVRQVLRVGDVLARVVASLPADRGDSLPADEHEDAEGNEERRPHRRGFSRNSFVYGGGGAGYGVQCAPTRLTRTR